MNGFLPVASISGSVLMSVLVSVVFEATGEQVNNHVIAWHLHVPGSSDIFLVDLRVQRDLQSP